MARRTKVQRVDTEVEKALEKALDVSFDEDVLADNVFGEEADLIDLDDLAQQIAQATAEGAGKKEGKIPTASPDVDPSVAEALFNKRASEAPAVPAGTVKESVVSETLRAANDDRGALKARNQLKQAKASSSRLYWSTTALSALWAAGGFAVAQKLIPAGVSTFAGLTTPMGIAVAAGTVIPIAMFWGFAQLAKRAKELQAAVRSISDAASRLAEPQKSPEERMVQVGQTVRQEISLVGEGLERTILRAAELEAMIHGEVQNLTRAYNENETRIQALIKELSSEREAILIHADRVKSTLRGTQDQLAGEFGTITANIADNVEKITATLTDTVRDKGDELIQRLSSAGDEISDKLAERVSSRTSELAEHLSVSTDEALKSFEEKFNRLDDRIIDRANQSITDFDERIANLTGRADSISTAFDTATEHAVRAFETRLSEMDSMLGERSNSIIHNFIARAQSLDDNTEKLGSVLENRVNEIHRTLQERTDEITKAFEGGYTQINDTLKERVVEIINAFNGSNNRINDVLKAHSDELTKTLGIGYEQIDGVLKERTNSIAKTFDDKSETIRESMKEHAGEITLAYEQGYKHISDELRGRVDEIVENVTFNHETIDATLKSRIAEISEAFEGGYQQLDETLRARVTEVVQNVVNNNTVIDDTLRNRISDISESFEAGYKQLDEILRARVNEIAHNSMVNQTTIDDALKGRIAEISQSFESNYKQLNEILENRVSEITTSVIDNKTAIDSTLRDRVAEITASFEGGYQQLDEILKSRTQDISNSVLSNQISIDDTLKGRIAEITASFEGGYQQLDDILKSRVSEVVQNVTSSHNLIDDTLKGRIFEVAEAFESGYQQMDTALKNRITQVVKAFEGGFEMVDGSLQSHTTQISETFASNQNKIDTTLSSIEGALKNASNDIGRALETGHTELQHTLSNSVSAFSQTLESGHGDIRGTLNDTVSTLGQTLQTGHSEMQSTLNNSVSAFSQTIQDGHSEMQSTLNNSVSAFSQTIQDGHSEIQNTLNNTVSTLGNALQNSHTELQGTLDNSIAAFNQTLDGGHSDLQNTLKGYSSEISNTLESERFNISTLVEQITERLNGEVEKLDLTINNLLQERADSFTQRLSEGREMLDAAMRSGGSNIVEAVKNQIDVLAGHIGDIEKALDSNIQLMNHHAVEHADNFSKRAMELSSTIENSVAVANEALDNQVRNMDIRANELRTVFNNNNVALNSTLADQAQILEERISHIREILSQSDINFADAIKYQISSVETVITENNDALRMSFEEHLKTLEGHTGLLKGMLEQSNELHGTVDNNTEKLSESLALHAAIIDDRTNTIQQALATGVDRMRDSLINGAASFTDTLRDRVAEASGTFTEKLQQAEVTANEISYKLGNTMNAFEEGMDKARSIADEEVDRISDKLHAKLENVTASVSDKVWEVGERITTAGAEAMKLVEDAASSMEVKLADRSQFLNSAAQQVETSLDTQFEQIGTRLIGITNQRMDDLNDQVSQIDRIGQALFNAAAKTGQSFGALSDQFAAQLDEAARTTEEKLRQGNDGLTEAFAKRAAETIASFHDAEHDIRQRIDGIYGNVSELLGQLNTSVANIQQCSSELTDGIASLDNKFRESTVDFCQNIGEIGQNVVASGRILENNVEVFHGLSQRTLEQMEEMGKYFNEHAQILSQAAEVLNLSQDNFTSTVENRQMALNALSSGLAVKSDEVSSIIKNYGEMIIAAMQNTQEQSKKSAFEMQEELGKLVAEAASKFSAATQEIRRNADEVRGELKTASSDITTSVQTLPEQTRLSTAAMSKAIADQINALKELTEVMSQSAGLVDVTRPASEVRRAENDKRVAASAASAMPQAKKDKKTGGWVSELLARASRDELENDDVATDVVEKPLAQTAPRIEQKMQRDVAEKAQPQTADAKVALSLNALSADIVGGINHNVVAELWAHYRRGSRNIQSNQLYTQDGLKTLAKIKLKYAEDKDFRRSVNQYIADFERLLRDISGREGKNAVQGYLTSDTGKVYTMLAHASGRIQ